MMIVALFDCDGTLFSAQFGRGLMKYASEQGDPKTVRKYYRIMLLPHILRSIKLISKERYHKPLIRNLALMIESWDAQEAEKGFRWVVEEYLLPTQFHQPAEILKRHLEKGHQVVLVSGILKPALEMVGKYYRAVETIGTVPEFKDQRYTGSTLPPAVMGRAKADLVMELFGQKGERVDWNNSYAYADSFLDREMMMLVGNPVAVNPDDKLRAYSLKNNWQILEVD